MESCKQGTSAHGTEDIDVEGDEDVAEREFLEHLTGVRAVNIEEFEEEFGKQIDAAIVDHEQAVEERRLAKTREQIASLEQRIADGEGRLGPARLSKLYDRLDELREEEMCILDRIESGSKLAAPVPSVEPKKVEVKKESSIKMVPKEKPVQKRRYDEYNYQEQEEVLEEVFEGEVVEDDFSDALYRSRLENWAEPTVDIELLFKKLEEQQLVVEDVVDVAGFKCPRLLYERLLEYQRTGLEWFSGLFNRRVGGILGDEMGLGKTVQVIAYLALLQASGRLNTPVLIVCPVTLMKQWIQELHYWWPPLRVFRLHSSETGHDPRDALVKAFKYGHVVITSYGHLRMFKGVLTKKEWRAVVLDEGHKIRNPDADVTMTCKRLRTPHRYILSGTPIQNSLTELWSLLDFCYPGRLGSLPVFKTEFALPINAGGYVNASSLQVQTAYKCACLLKDMIGPYLLRRVKADVAHELPQKQEQVLFCQISPYQRDLYQFILDSDVIQSVLAGKRNILAGIDLLRKVCNHPALLVDGPLSEFPDFPEPYGEVSGKMGVLGQTLRMWHERGHRALLFCQTRQMLDLVQAFVHQQKYTYLRMDGNTGVKERGGLVDRFNGDRSTFLFLLTTKVGGLGLNLTGADRVLIFDPDWNPSTDLQARERAWRLGQTRPVTIYRLITAGTIEEKIYHRQLWKQYLTNRVLADPKQSRFFKSSDLHDLFSLDNSQDETNESTETAQLFSGLDLEINQKDTKEDHVLSSLFEMTGLHSAIQHDRLVDRPRQETLLVEREAARMAEQAAAALRASMQQRLQEQAVEEPTWTGAKKRIIPKVKQSNGTLPSSAAILASARARQAADQPNNDTSLDSRLSKILDRLLLFFEEHHGVCRSDAIAERFRDALEPGQEAAFRHLLKTISVFDPVSRSWRLHRDLLNPS